MPSFTVFRPPGAIGVVYGAGISLVSFLLGAGLLYRGLTMDVKLMQIMPLLVGAFFVCLGALYAYWAWSCSSLRYVVDRNALTIRWGNLQQVIPLTSIERLIPGGSEAPPIEGINWTGHHVGRAEVPQLGEVLFYSGHRAPPDILYVVTAMNAYAISVPDAVFFAQTIQSNQSRGPLFDQRQAVRRSGFAAQSFWLDPTARLMTIALLGSFILVLAYVLNIYPGLNQTVPLRFPAFGGIARVSEKSELLDIPRSAFGFLCVDLALAVLLHTWERMVGYVLLLAGIGIQVMLLIAAIVAVA